uniref:Uncharacterized protein n=1 Tax=Arundo donax TaxID=35708 RepID=A0A0A9DY32_ARUDO
MLLCLHQQQHQVDTDYRNRNVLFSSWLIKLTYVPSSLCSHGHM